MNDRQKIPSLDGLRAVSIMLVLMGHCLRANPLFSLRYEGIQSYAGVGVIMFFVISGFLITTLLLDEKIAKDRIDIRRFYIRRALRIIPVSFLYIGCVLLLNGPLALGVEPGAFLHAFTYTVNFGVLPAVLGHLWSLSVEEQFYLCWPWIMRFSVTGIMTAALIIVVYAPVVRVVYYFFPDLGTVTLMPFFKHADALMIGCLLAISRRFRPSWWGMSLLKNDLLMLVAIALILGIPLLDVIKGHHVGYLTTPFGRTIISLSTAYLIASVVTVKDNRAYRFLNYPLMVYIGVLSYSIYVWQQFFFFSGSALWPAWARLFPVNILLILAVSMASYHLWELRFLKLKEHFRAAS